MGHECNSLKRLQPATQHSIVIDRNFDTAIESDIASVLNTVINDIDSSGVPLRTMESLENRKAKFTPPMML